MPRLPWIALLSGLVLSGVAGIVNQVVWQRALKLFLGGSETLSAMIVVLVFLFGLGAGAGLAGRVAGRVANPLRALAGVELGLALVNIGVASLLALDLTESVYAVQRVALSVGLPLRGVYAVAALVLLLPPTLLMGATLPLASEACQRQLGATDAALVPALFFVNTVGAAAGALGASLWLLPHFGQRDALFAAVACNTVAAALIGGLGRRPPVALRAAPATHTRRPLTREELLGGALGLLALSYEMLLFRALSLAHWPLPVTFAAGLSGFLIAWSLGMAVARLARGREAPVALVTAVLVALLPTWLDFDRSWGLLELGPAVALYALPCVGFGVLYGLLVTRAAGDWGRDVGRYAALNTLGSCAGVLWFTLVGFEAPLWHGAMALAAGLAAVGAVEGLRGAPGRGASGLLVVGGGATLIIGLMTPFTTDDDTTTWWGRDGVIEVTDDGDVRIDGLWHTRLTDGRDHVGRPYSWVMAMAAVTAREGPLDRALVIGAGVGISSVTLAGVEGLAVDGYEINQTLRPVLEALPHRTLDALNRDDVRWIWQDARTGLALDETRYDVILSAPLHLRQAGSSMLLSQEYLRLAKSRLQPGGILAVYANEGEPAQALLVQRTLAEAFAYRQTWYDGLVTICSDQPITVTAERIDAFMQRPGRLPEEMRRLDAELVAQGNDGLWSLYDGDGAAAWVADIAISDDWPLLEYPALAERLVQRVPASDLHAAP